MDDEDEEEEAKEPNFEGKNLSEINTEIKEENESKEKVEKKDQGTNTDFVEEKILEKVDISDLDREEE